LATATAGLSAGPAHAARGHVYVSTNAEAGNAVIVFNRDAKGRLYQGGVFETGGKGAGGNPTFPVPISDSDGLVSMSPNGKVLFAVNIGSNTVTSFRVHGNGLTRVATVSSGGVGPNATDAQNGVLYVTNTGGANPDHSPTGAATMMGYRYDSKGHMTPIAGSQTALPAQSLPAAVRLDPQLKYLVVTERGVGPDAAGQTQRFALNGGVPGQAVDYPPAAGSHHPFALALTRNDVIVTGDEGNPPPDGPGGDSRLTTYNVGDPSSTAPLDSQPDGATATCWIVLTGNERYGFASSALSGDLKSFTLSPQGAMNITGTVHLSQFVATDLGMSRDSKFLYATTIDVDPMALAFKSARIDIFRVSSNGTLTPMGSTAPSLLGSTAGMVAR
jgi:hypothetical protein